MANGLLDRLRGARRIELWIALAVAALLALTILRPGTDHSGAGKTELELRMERILSQIEGAGRVSVMITQDAEDNVTGALVVAEALEDAGTYLCLQRAVMALLDVEAADVEIVSRSGDYGGVL